MTALKHRWIYPARLLAVGVLALGAGIPAAHADGGSRRLREARAGTERFRDIDAARDAGYGLLVDVDGISCIDNPGVGAMGVHYVKGELVGSPTVDAATPEALVYQPEADGRLRLVAVEYVVLKAAWEGAGNTAAPRLFDQEFGLIGSPNRFGLPPFYELHAWIWKHNPRGMFDDWNPRVHCPRA